MRTKLTCLLSSGIVVTSLAPSPLLAAPDDAKPAEKITFAEHVSGIFRNRCGSCHNPDKAKGGLNLDNYGAALQGGGSGKVIEPGDVESSTLLGVITHQEEPKMPPNSDKIPDAEIDLIRKWIEGGALENSGSTAAVKAKPKLEFKVDPSALGKPSGPPAMPENLSTEPFTPQAKPGAVLAMATSPWAPLLAVAGHKQVLLYRSTDFHLAGVLPFPDGLINVLKFSRNGDLLLVGGGRGGQSGIAVAFNVKTGERVFEVGKEYDAVLAADISPDHSQVALGGPNKVVRIYSTADGSLQFEMKKHTEWITAAEFSPDGVLLATGDRNNGLFVWESNTGREFLELKGHSAAITDLSWRIDSNVVASSSEDGAIKFWELENGGNIKSIAAHGGGAASVRFAKDGRVVSAGRDRMVRVWDANGGKQREFEAFNDLALRAVFSQDETRVFAADWTGEIRAWQISDGQRLANLAVNPAPVAVRLDAAQKAQAAAQAEAESLAKDLPPLEAALATAQGAEATALKALADATEAANAQNAAVAQHEAAVTAKTAAINEAEATTKAAEEIASQAQAQLAAAEKAVTDMTAAEQAAVAALAAARTAIENALAEKVAQEPALAAAGEALRAAKTPEETTAAIEKVAGETQRSIDLLHQVSTAVAQQQQGRQAVAAATAAKTAAPEAVAPAQVRVKAAELGLQAAREAVARAGQEKTNADQVLAAARAAAQTATANAANLKTAADQATEAKAAAEKALADKRGPADAAIARAQALKAEIEALTIESKRPNPGKDGLAAAQHPEERR